MSITITLRCFYGLLFALLLSSCTAVRFQPIRTIDAVTPEQGYRLEHALTQNKQDEHDEMLLVMAFSGGGTRAAALGYGVLEDMTQRRVWVNRRASRLSDEVDLVFGISGGAVLAAYYGLHGSAVVPAFERNFLKQNLQKQVIRQVLAAPNWARLTSPEFGRGEVLQEELDRVLFHRATYDDLLQRRRGPFVVIAATDMNSGGRIDFTQESFDMLCLDLRDMPISRAVAASSAVPLVFAPLTLNNHGGHCGYQIPTALRPDGAAYGGMFRSKTQQEFAAHLASYTDSGKRPYIHLLDGGLTDNLGLRGMLDVADMYSEDSFYDQFTDGAVDKIVLINVNAQNRPTSVIDESAAIPKMGDVLRAVINIPIDRNSQETLRQFRRFVDHWQQNPPKNRYGKPIGLYFISLNLNELDDARLRDKVLNIRTSFYLPSWEVAALKQAARDLLRQSEEYRRLLRDVSPPPRPIQGGDGAVH